MKSFCKKIVIYILAAVLIVSLPLLLTSCKGEAAVIVESQLNIDENFSGSRVIGLNLPNGIDTASALKVLSDNCPKTPKGAFALKQDGLKIEFVISFENQQGYIDAVKSLLKRDVTVCYAKLNNLLTQGTRLEEDFDISELTQWIADTLQSGGFASNIQRNYHSNLVSINGEILPTGTTVSINSTTGHAVKGITIDTVNNKNNSYSRRFTFSLPEETYTALGDSVKEFFEANTDAKAQYSQWTRKGAVLDYEVTFSELTQEELAAVTNKLLAVTDCTAVYGDKENKSTALTQSLVFEERLDFFGFLGPQKSAVPVQYLYSLPSETEFGSPTVLQQGKWEALGDKINGVYTLDITQSSLNINIPDGIKYQIDGIDVILENKGEDSFIRTFDIHYSGEKAEKAVNYAIGFFKGKEANATKQSDNNGTICRVIFSGKSSDINKWVNRVFGSSNSFQYSRSGGFLSVADTVALTDNIDLTALLVDNNIGKLVKYTVTAVPEEAISSLNANSGSTNTVLTQGEKTGGFTVELGSGTSVVKTYSSIANTNGIVVYVLIAVFLAIGFVALLVRNKNKEKLLRQKLRRQGEQPESYKMNL
ncbi:MAG: hypothetical protein LBM65_05220 [Oscillospiraceae bacterium]|nr:hypothetical protein [Oscillospiraceae bacterium]